MQRMALEAMCSHHLQAVGGGSEEGSGLEAWADLEVRSNSSESNADDRVVVEGIWERLALTNLGEAGG